ncbi:Hypothetical protein SMAX5B_005331 [Scophthalmus maximus]|uniref:Uncharacterized protein n=1 Tax=Scophthalmus maximus TaxID=52904 RepID=A0A2U9BBG9_SCOMX|nr:Hypothetical protein SMAX5B_005331 [Scophthalmus maximus]
MHSGLNVLCKSDSDPQCVNRQTKSATVNVLPRRRRRRSAAPDRTGAPSSVNESRSSDSMSTKRVIANSEAV